jgi:hypothetical protein
MEIITLYIYFEVFGYKVKYYSFNPSLRERESAVLSGGHLLINTGAETCATTDLYLWRIHFQHPKRTPSSTLLPSREKESFMLSICNTNRGSGGLRFAPPTLQILIAECHFLPVSCEKHGRIRRV